MLLGWYASSEAGSGCGVCGASNDTAKYVDLLIGLLKTGKQSKEALA